MSLEEHAFSDRLDPRVAADEAGLRYVNADEPGLSRRRAGRGFTYRNPAGRTVREAAALKRIRALAVPPAWVEVWICADGKGHIQATGRDQRGRKQYRYHPDFRALRESAKYEQILHFAELLPTIRTTVSAHMGLRGLPREKVLATTVHLLETTLIRVGNDDYARQNRSYGLTTLQRRHVVVSGSELKFRFMAKSGKMWERKLTDRRAARIIKACQELPGQALLQYVDAGGGRHDVSSGDVNEYLREITGSDVTAKHFRTWAGTVSAALALAELEAVESPTAAKRNLRRVIDRVANRLGNTPTICRKCYVHPEIVDAYLGAALELELDGVVDVAPRGAAPCNLYPEEAAVIAFLQGRIEGARPVVEGRALARRAANEAAPLSASA
ncbi:DNA topoisomerase IB [Acuticoccus kandeliae]|uniref:DNA topoisomerase IB n=1 Tax=Acuticoccus kandeliae TaxID=2073160 RepID=UPI000D3E3666|nr:DNA topoisomerase IB [Acuticoccus kandeliae]